MEKYNLEYLKKTGCAVIVLKDKCLFSETYQKDGDVGKDLYCYVDNMEDNPVVINPGECKLVPTGVKTMVPRGYHFEVRPRSSLFIKHNLLLVNSPGTIDPSYRGEIRMPLLNMGKEPFVARTPIRLCQLCLIPYVDLTIDTVTCITVPPSVEFVISGKLFKDFENVFPTERGVGGFGSTGTS